MLQGRSTQDNRAEQDPLQRLRLPDRDEVHIEAVWLHDQGGTDHICQPSGGNIKDEYLHIWRGSLWGAEAPMVGNDKTFPSKRTTETQTVEIGHTTL